MFAVSLLLLLGSLVALVPVMEALRPLPRSDFFTG